MNFRELSDYLRQYTPTPSYDSITGELRVIVYEELGIKKKFKYSGDNMIQVTISGNIPSGTTQTVMYLEYDINDEWVGSTFS